MWSHLLERLRVARVRASFRAAADGAAPPFPGASFRGALGRALRQAACATGMPSCVGCPLTARCAYGYLFETHVPAASARMRLYPYAPHPMVLRPPPAIEAWREGDEVDLEVILFGRGIDYLPYLLYALGEMGRAGVGPERVPLEIRSADLLGPNARRIYDGATLAAGDCARPARAHLSGPPRADERLVFLSPARVQYRGEPARDLPAHVLARALARRLASLAYFHEGIEIEADFRALLERARAVPTRSSRLAWREQYRASARQGRPHPLGGAVGEVTYADVPPEIGTLFALGELTHVGKGTSFGLGRYERRAA